MGYAVQAVRGEDDKSVDSSLPKNSYNAAILRIGQLPKRQINKCQRADLSPTIMYVLADDDRRKELIESVVSGKMTARQLKAAVRAAETPRQAAPGSTESVHQIERVYLALRRCNKKLRAAEDAGVLEAMQSDDSNKATVSRILMIGEIKDAKQHLANLQDALDGHLAKRRAEDDSQFSD